MKVFTTLSAVLALASAESDAFFPHGGIRPLAQQQLRQPAIQLRPTVQTYGVGMIQQDPMFGTAARRVGANSAAAAAAAAAAGTPVSPRFTYFEVNQQMQQPIMPMREGEMFEYDVNYVESKKDDKDVVGSSDSVLGIKETGDVYRFKKGDYDVKVNIKGVEASSYRKPEDKERDVEVKINGHAGNSNKQDKKHQEDIEGRRRGVDGLFNEQDSYSRSVQDNRLEDDEPQHDVQVKIKSASGSRKQQDQQQQQDHDVTGRQQQQQKNDYRARQDYVDGHHDQRRMMSYHRLDQDRMRHMADRQRLVADRQMSAYSGMDMSDRQMMDRQMAERQMVDRQLADRHMTDRQMSDRHMTDRQMSDRHMTDRQMADSRQMSDRHMTDRQMSDRHMTDRQMADSRQMSDRHMTDRQMGDRRLTSQMDMPNERRVYDERLRMMSDRRMADRRMADRRHLLPAYRQRFNNELNEFNNARRTINNSERSRLFKREAGFDYNVVASHPPQTKVYRMDNINMMPFGGNRVMYYERPAAMMQFRGRQQDIKRQMPVHQSIVEF